MKTVEQYRVFQTTLKGTKARGTFQCGEDIKTVQGFLSGDNQVTVRFMPDKQGQWDCSVISDLQEENSIFQCVPPTSGNHGPVKVYENMFFYADGSRYFPFGTTCYGWIHQVDSIREHTLQSLADSPFNKLRMLLFPKFMPYNTGEPRLFPFMKDANGNWDVSNPNFSFWDDLDRQILALDQLGIETDLILFHPYDRWGFATMSREDNLIYLTYCVSRLGAYKNIWWSLANEYDMVPGKTKEDWDAFAQQIVLLDSYHHLLSIHNCCQPYPMRDWMTHCSIQTNLCRQTLILGWKYHKPILIDECGYEGNIEFTWGNLSAFEMVNRFWTTVACGGWCTHGETFYQEDEVLWWGKGGKLHGKSVSRIAFLRQLLETLPGVPQSLTASAPVDPNGSENMGQFGFAIGQMPEATQEAFIAELIPMVFGNQDYRIYYLGRACPAWIDIQCPGEGTFNAEVIDIWEMTRTAAGIITKNGRIPLPGKEGQAVLLYKE